MGSVLTIIGIKYWTIRERNEELLKYRINIDKPTYSDRCQSCGKRFNSVVQYADDGNIKNYSFCNSCYKDGSFIEPNLTKAEMKLRTKDYLISYNVEQKEIKKIVKKIDSLDRWSYNSY